MAQHFDLEEQEQLDQIKHFWKQYGNAITWVLIVVLGASSAWIGWNEWQRRQAAQASALYDEVDRASQSGDTALLERAFADIKDRYGRTTYASQAAMLAARVYSDKGNNDGARAALAWVAANSSDDGYKALARLRLAALQMEAKAYDDALQTLGAPFPAEFQPLAADRKADVYLAQGKRAEAKAEYQKAYTTMGADVGYRALVAIKLNSLGVDPKTLTPATPGMPEAK